MTLVRAQVPEQIDRINWSPRYTALPAKTKKERVTLLLGMALVSILLWQTTLGSTGANAYIVIERPDARSPGVLLSAGAAAVGAYVWQREQLR